MEKIPDWLCTEFLTECLKHEEDKQNIVVIKFKVSPAISPGEQYASCPLRVEVDYKENDELHTLSLIIKSEVSEGVVKEVVSSYGSCESVFYNTFLPKANLLLRIDFIPKSIFSPNSSLIVLEDLTQERFVMADKVTGLDFEHCCLYMEATAALHAVSLALRKEDPGLVESLGREKIYLNGLTGPEGFKAMTLSGLKCLADYAETSETFNKYADLIRDLLGSIWDITIEAIRSSRESPMMTLNHGDPWTNNLMFKYNSEGKPSEIRLLDFQMMRCGSPANDLVFFIWSSANDDVRTNRLDELFQIYVESFNRNLEQLNCIERLSCDSLREEMLKLSPLVICTASFFPPYCAKKAIVDVEPFFLKGNSEICYNIYRSFFREEGFWNCRLPKLFQQLELIGVFDYLSKNKK
uniref:CHK kinase-like domain-containing protein n=1 Tax=Cuerna arida TaxID=1464854 RepID=A0A1B6FFN8_9HEMI